MSNNLVFGTALLGRPVVQMGGLAIVTLAGDHIHRAARALGVADSLADGIRWVTQVTSVVATLWIPVLVYVGLRRILRHTGVLWFAGVWWAMVFPLGMYSAAHAGDVGGNGLAMVADHFAG